MRTAWKRMERKKKKPPKKKEKKKKTFHALRSLIWNKKEPNHFFLSLFAARKGEKLAQQETCQTCSKRDKSFLFQPRHTHTLQQLRTCLMRAGHKTPAEQEWLNGKPCSPTMARTTGVMKRNKKPREAWMGFLESAGRPGGESERERERESRKNKLLFPITASRKAEQN